MLLNTMEMKWNESVVDKDNFSMKELVTGKMLRRRFCLNLLNFLPANSATLIITEKTHD